MWLLNSLLGLEKSLHHNTLTTKWRLGFTFITFLITKLFYRRSFFPSKERYERIACADSVSGLPGGKSQSTASQVGASSLELPCWCQAAEATVFLL